MIKVENSNKDWIEQLSIISPNKTAIESGSKVLTYSEFDDKIDLYACNLIKLGVEKNDKVGILSENNLEFIILIFALWRINACIVPINTRLNPSAVNELKSKLDLRHLLASENLKGKFNFIHNSFPFDSSIKHDKIAFDSTLNPDNVCLLQLTSGSTSKPKAVQHTFNTLFASVEKISSFLPQTDNEKWLASLPFYHIGGLSIVLRSVLRGAELFIPSDLRYESLSNSIREKSISHISLVGTQIEQFVEDEIKPPESLKTAFIGGGPVSNEIVKKAVDLCWPIVKIYGSSETAAMVTAFRVTDFPKKIESSGKVLKDVEIEIQNDGKKLSSNEIGEIFIKSKSNFVGYYNDIEINPNSFISNGDIGFLDEDGFLFVLNRRSDLIVSGGENIIPSDVEKIILKHENVSECVVIGIENRQWGQKVCAAVVVNNDIQKKDIMEYLRENLTSYMIPKEIIFIKKIPKTSLGKIDREKLKNLFD